MLPFPIELRAGEPIYLQIVYAVKKAIVGGLMQPEDRFPSVRAISRELKVNPNTVQKAVSILAEQGLLESRAGQGSYVLPAAISDSTEKKKLLRKELEEVIVEAKRLGLDVEEVIAAVRDHWQRLRR